MFFFTGNNRDKLGRFRKGNSVWKQRKLREIKKLPIAPQSHVLEVDLSKLTTKQDPLVRGFFMGDGHYNDPKLTQEDQKMINIEPTLKFLADFKPHIVGICGDWWDFSYLSHWNVSKLKDFGHKRIAECIEAEADQIYQMLKQIKEVSGCKFMFYMKGNHEVWFDQYQDEYQKLNKKSIADWLRFEELGITLVEENDIVKIGRLGLKHGEHYGGENPAKQAIMKSHRTIAMWHHHSYIVWPGYSDVDVTEKLQAFCVPGMCKIASMDYMKRRPNNWSVGFMTAYFKPSGKFTPYIYSISHKGNFLAFGKEYE